MEYAVQRPDDLVVWHGDLGCGVQTQHLRDDHAEVDQLTQRMEGEGLSAGLTPFTH